MATRPERSVSARRMRALINLLGEAGELAGDDVARRAHLVAGMARLVGAAFVATVLDSDFHRHGRGRLSDIAAHGLDGASSSVVSVLAADGTVRHPALRCSMRCDDYAEPLVWNRRTRAPDAIWYRDSYFTDFVQPLHLDDCILGAARLDAHTVIGVGAMRERQDSPFTSEDEALLEGYADAARRLWLCAPPIDPRSIDPRVAALPPRLARLHRAMLGAGSEKELAAALSLSPHSVHTYARELYRRLGVRSRAELMARATARE